MVAKLGYPLPMLRPTTFTAVLTGRLKAKGVTLEECRQSGKDALAYFVQSGLVDDRCGTFRENPKKSKTGGPPQDVAPQEDGRHVAPQEEDHPEL